MRRHGTAHWTGQALTSTPEGGILFRLRIPRRGWIPGLTIRLELDRDQAAVVQAQLDRIMSRGWATTETARGFRERGEQAHTGVPVASASSGGHTAERYIPTTSE